MRNSWKRTSAFVLAFTLVAAPLSINQGIFKGGIGIVANAAEELTFTYTLGDSSDDQWNDAYIHIYDEEDNWVTSITMVDADTNSDSFNLKKGVNYKFVWESGSYPEECSFTITDENGNAFFGRKPGECANDEDGAVIKQFTAGETSPKIANASVTLNDAMGLNFYVDNIASADGYTVKLEGKCLESEQKIAQVLW